jgi:hypothetical protein
VIVCPGAVTGSAGTLDTLAVTPASPAAAATPHHPENTSRKTEILILMSESDGQIREREKSNSNVSPLGSRLSRKNCGASGWR